MTGHPACSAVQQHWQAVFVCLLVREEISVMYIFFDYLSFVSPFIKPGVVDL